MALSQFSEVRVSPAQGAVTITAQLELRYIPAVALLISLYFMFEAGSLSRARSIRLAWAPLGPIVAAFAIGELLTGPGGGSGSAGNGSSCHLGVAALVATAVAVGVAAIDILAPPPSPPPLFPPPISLRALLVCSVLLFSTIIFGLVHGLRQADDAIARH